MTATSSSPVLGVGGVRQDVLLGVVVVDGVLVAAENADGVATDTHTRPGDLSLVDGIAEPPSQRAPHLLYPCRARQVKPASRSAFAARVAIITRWGTDSMTV